MTYSTDLALYANAGSTLFHYAVDVEAAAIALRGSVTLPVGVQYAWPHPHAPFLYVACSNGSPGVHGNTHCAVALHIEPATGALSLHGNAVALPSRPIHITVDTAGTHALVAYNYPSGVTVHRIGPDHTLGPALPQPPLDTGVFAHQIRVMPSGRAAIVVTRGNDPSPGRPEDPGALKVFGYDGGRLSNLRSVAPGGGYGYGPRHLDFDPRAQRLYVSLERENRVHVYATHDADVEPEPSFVAETLQAPANVRPDQRAGTIHVHPNGRVLYVANRASGTVDAAGEKVFIGGENNLAVYVLDERTGEPSLIQHEDTRGFVPRTFAIDPTGRLLVVANAQAMRTRTAAGIRVVPANLALFRVGADGRLAHVATHDLDTAGATLFWMGLVPLATRSI